MIRVHLSGRHSMEVAGTKTNVTDSLANNEACSERISLAMQFVASLFWAVGATLAGPSSVADYLHLFAALAWCIANIASAWSMHRRPFEVDAITLKNAKLSRV